MIRDAQIELVSPVTDSDSYTPTFLQVQNPVWMWSILLIRLRLGGYQSGTGLRCLGVCCFRDQLEK